MDSFKEISLGGLTKESLLQRLGDSGIRFNRYAEILFDHPSFCPSLTIESVRLVKLSLNDLGLSNPCSYQTITDQAASLGLSLCPLYLGAFLRLEFLNQPEGPYLTIASHPLKLDKSQPTGFYIRNFEGSLWLRGYRVEGDADWPQDNSFVFRK